MRAVRPISYVLEWKNNKTYYKYSLEDFPIDKTKYKEGIQIFRAKIRLR